MIEGYVDGLDRNGIWGWARRVGSDEPVVVEFVCDGSVIASTVASGFRRDLSEAGLPRCAFEFDPGLFEDISPWSKIAIRVSGERVALKNGIRDPNLQDSMKYARAWTRPATLDELNRDIHDSWPIDRLYERAARYHDIAFNDLLKGTELPEAPKILEIGSGVGWLMQVLIDLLPKAHVTGLDVSKIMIARAQERFGALPSKGKYAGKLDFVLYGGRDFPFSRDEFDLIYSYATLWHIPDVLMFRVLREALRVLKPRGVGAFHFLPTEGFIADLDNQVAVQFDGASGHHHYYRAPEMLARVLVEGFGATDFSMIKRDGYHWLGISKGGACRYRSRLLESSLKALKHAVARK